MRFVSLWFIITVGLCAQEKAPAWLSDVKSSYPDGKYLVAIGSGDTRRAAEQMGAASLSMIFGAAINSEQTVVERFKESFGNGSSTMDHTSDVSKDVTVSSNQTLYNIQFGESYTDSKGITFIVAYLERGTTAAIYQKMIADNAEQVKKFLQQFEVATDPVDRYVWINAASVYSSMNEAMRRQLSIIQPRESEGTSLGYDHLSVMKKYGEAMRGVVFAIDIANDTDRKIATIMKESLAGLGFTVGTTPILTLKGVVTFEPVVLQRPEKFVRWSYAFNLTDSSGAVLTMFADSGREGHMTHDEARARAVRTMRTKIKDSLGKSIVKYFDGKVQK